MTFLLILVGIFLASNPQLLELHNFNESFLDALFQKELQTQQNIPGFLDRFLSDECYACGSGYTSEF